MSLSHQDLLSEIQYALQELPDGEPDGGASWPSEVWTRATVLQAVNDAAAVFVRETRVVTRYVEQPVLIHARSVSMPGDWLASAHLVFRALPSQQRSYLAASDAFEADQGASGWETNEALPYGYIDGDAQTLEIRLVPTPNTNGTLENLYIPQPDPIDGQGATLPIPDLAASALKYGALGILLSGATRLQDPVRAQYCQDRVAVTAAAVQVLLQGGA